VQGGTPSGAGGAMSTRVYGMYQSATNPHINRFYRLDQNVLALRAASTTLKTTAFTNFSSNNFPPGNNQVYDVTSIVQEMVNNPNWDPTSAVNGGRIGFVFAYQSGNGTRRINKVGTGLSVSYSTSSPAPTVNNDSVIQWIDRSGNGNNLFCGGYGANPVRIDNSLNSLTVVRFASGACQAELNTAITNLEAVTALAVVRPNASSSSDARIVSLMNSAQAHDYNTVSGLVPLSKSGSTTSLSARYNNVSSIASATNVFNGAAHILVNQFSNGKNPFIKKTSVITNNASAVTLTGGSINQVFVGGRRNGVGGSGTDFLNGDVGELVVYPRELSCREIEAVEEYLRVKWAIAASPWPTNCPTPEIPTL
jgi:hypothetical protein